jgi:hypothetical protein
MGVGIKLFTMKRIKLDPKDELYKTLTLIDKFQNNVTNYNDRLESPYYNYLFWKADRYAKIIRSSEEINRIES